MGENQQKYDEKERTSCERKCPAGQHKRQRTLIQAVAQTRAPSPPLPLQAISGHGFAIRDERKRNVVRHPSLHYTQTEKIHSKTNLMWEERRTHFNDNNKIKMEN